MLECVWCVLGTAHLQADTGRHMGISIQAGAIAGAKGHAGHGAQEAKPAKQQGSEKQGGQAAEGARNVGGKPADRDAACQHGADCAMRGAKVGFAKGAGKAGLTKADKDAAKDAKPAGSQKAGDGGGKPGKGEQAGGGGAAAVQPALAAAPIKGADQAAAGAHGSHSGSDHGPGGGNGSLPAATLQQLMSFFGPLTTANTQPHSPDKPDATHRLIPQAALDAFAKANPGQPLPRQIVVDGSGKAIGVLYQGNDSRAINTGTHHTHGGTNTHMTHVWF